MVVQYIHPNGGNYPPPSLRWKNPPWITHLKGVENLSNPPFKVYYKWWKIPPVMVVQYIHPNGGNYPPPSLWWKNPPWITHLEGVENLSNPPFKVYYKWWIIPLIMVVQYIHPVVEIIHPQLCGGKIHLQQPS